MKFKSPLDHLMNHDCTDCVLHEYTDRVCVGGRGDVRSRIMLVGEAPGSNEERTGEVFSGRAGQLLDLKLREAGLDPAGVYITNVAKCRPPDNRTPERVEWKACRQYLESELRAIKPSHLLILGNSALQSVAGKSGITKQRGVKLNVKDPLLARTTVMATVHPAYVLRNPGQDSIFSEDVRRFARAVRGDFQVVAVRKKYVTTVGGLKALRAALLALPAGTVLAYDVENRHRPWDKDWSIQMLGVSWDGETAYVVPLFHPESPFEKSWLKVLKYLKPALEREDLKLIAQNGKHDNVQLAGANIFVRHKFDIMLAAHLIDENRPKNLGFLSQSILGADEYKGMVELKPEKILQTDLRQMAFYNGNDVGYSHQIYQKLRPELLVHPRLTRLFSKLMMPASHVIQEVEYHGMWVDQERLFDRMAILQEAIKGKRDILCEDMSKEMRTTFNHRSPQQVAKWAYGKESKGGLGLEPLFFTKTGNASTNEDALIAYAEHPAIQALFALRTLEMKWMNTYLLPWSTKLDSRSRIHTTYKLYNTVTGRISGDLQQVPRDAFIRSIIGAPPGWQWVDADFSQVELRIAAHIANERAMKRAYQLGQDLHMVTAMSMTGKSADEVGKEERKKAKPVNFGFLYGMYPAKFQSYAIKNYGVVFSISECELFRQKYFEAFPDLRKWHDRQKRIVRERSYVVSPLGRVRHLPDILSSDHGIQMEAERQAINSPVQGCASDIMLFAMIQLRPQLNPKEAYMVMTLHDGIGFNIKEDRVDYYKPIIKEVMENLPLKKTFGLDLSVPLEVEVESGQYWGGIEDASGLGFVGYS